MSEIEKMYKNAGIKPKYSGWLDMGDLDTQMTHIQCDTKEEWDECVLMSRSSYSSDDENYDKPKMEYPPFTAEKQIGLIKLLGNVRDFTVEIDKFKGVYYVGCRSAGSNDKLWGSSNIFEDALAELINETWFCLTEEEKQQIKEILE